MRNAWLVLLLVSLPAAAGELHFAADRPFDLSHLRLEGRLDLKKRELAATATLSMSALRKTRAIRLDAVGLAIERVEQLRGAGREPRPVAWTHDGEHLEIELEEPFARGERTALRIEYVCRDPEAGLHFFGPDEAEPDTPYQVWSQGETATTRYWIPIFDQPNERLTSELLVTADRRYQVLSNGTLDSVTERDGKKTWHWKQDRDHVPYLITLVAGTFAITRAQWRGRPIEYWVPPGRAADTMRSFANTPRMLDFFSDRIGVEYPWPKYAQVVVEQFAFGGMENTSATTLNERTLHDERAHLDYSSDGLVAHELAHQWFGDLITCRDWAHTWLNEGFASYFEALWTEHDLGRDEFLFNMLGKSRSAISGGKKLPIVYRGYKGPWEQFDSRAYPKGAFVLHMLRRRLGDDAFWRGIRAYARAFAHHCVETDDLRRAFEDETGVSLGRFFFDWTKRPGHPLVEVGHGWKADAKTAVVRIRQTQKEEAFHFPLRVDFRCGDRTLTVTHEVTDKDTRFVVPLPARPSLVRVDPDFSVLMELTERKGRDLWLAQLRTDPSPVLRIRAVEHFAGSRRDADRKALADALATGKFWGVRAEIAKALGKSGGDVSRDALLGALAGGHPKARHAVVEALGHFKGDAKVTAALGALLERGDPSYSVTAAAIRAWAAQRPDGALERLRALLAVDSHRDAIREAALDGLGRQGDAAATATLLAWTKRGHPRNCRRAALGALERLARAGAWERDTQAQVAGALAACLARPEHRSLKVAAATALRALGDAADPARAALEALAEHDLADNVREQAKKTLEALDAGAPPRLQLQRLREEIGRLRDEQRRLRGRVQELERKQPLPLDEGR